LRNISSLAVFAALVVLAAYTGAQFLPGDWYAALNKPTWTPSNWVFPVVWPILYVIIAVAGWLAWRAAGWSPAIIVWGVGLFFNGLWSYLMFGRHEISIALADIAPDALVDGPVVFAADLGQEIDNLEGIDAHVTPEGETVLTMVSDDNFSLIQRTLLLQFSLVE